MPVTVAGLLVLAWRMHRFVEKPFGPRLKRALATVRVREAAAR